MSVSIIGRFLKEKNDIWILYYIVLSIIIMSWTSMSSFPPLPFRLGMIVAVFCPLFFKAELIPFVFTAMIFLRTNLMTAYSYLPDVHSFQIYYFVLIMLLILKREYFCFTHDYRFFLCLFLLWMFTDIAANGELGKYTVGLGYILLIYPFIVSEDSINSMALGLMVISGMVAQYYMINRVNFLVEFVSNSGLERADWMDPNYFSAQILIGYVMGLLYLVGFLKSNSIFANKFMVAFFMILSFIGIVTLASRGTFFGMLVLTLGAVMIARTSFIFKVLLFVLFISTVIYYIGTGGMDLLIYRLTEEDTFEGGNGRLDIWLNFLDLWRQENLLLILLGHGYQDVSSLTQHHLHNDLLGILNCYGIIGVLLYFVKLFTMLKSECSVDIKRTILICIGLFIYEGLSLCISYNYTFLIFLTFIIGLRTVYSNGKI